LYSIVTEIWFSGFDTQSNSISGEHYGIACFRRFFQVLANTTLTKYSILSRFQSDAACYISDGLMAVGGRRSGSCSDAVCKCRSHETAYEKDERNNYQQEEHKL
jgi:hypothetical protein